MNDLNRYNDFDPSDFLLDEGFVDWVKSDDKENHDFWKEVLIANPQLEEKIQKARKLLSMLDSKDPVISESIKNRIWNSVKSASSGAKVIRMQNRRIWIAAASVLILIAGAGIVWKMGKKEGRLMARQEKNSQLLPNNDVAPGGNKAILTLADGSKVVLDSANNGAITKQGNVIVMKLDDGQIAYKLSTPNSQPSTADRPTTVLYNTVSTPRGGQYQLTLADGTMVWLNAASSIKYPTSFRGNERRIEITGEAYFEVAHDASKPFYVKVNSDHAYSSTEIKVLGTKFNVNAYSDEEMLKASLLQGSIQISSHGKENMLKPGQQADIKNNEEGISIKDDVDMSQVVAWKNGYFQFDDFTIQQIMRQLARWYNVDVVYKGKLPGGHFVGKPSRDLNLSQILKVIEYSGVHLKIDGDKIIVGN